MVMLFDFSSMQAAEQIRSKQAAVNFLSTQMAASDVVSIMTFGTELQTVQDFTSDPNLLLVALERFKPTSVATGVTQPLPRAGSSAIAIASLNLFEADQTAGTLAHYAAGGSVAGGWHVAIGSVDGAHRIIQRPLIRQGQSHGGGLHSRNPPNARHSLVIKPADGFRAVAGDWLDHH